MAHVEGFTTGLRCLGSSTGFVYNNVSLGDLRTNKYGIILDGENGGWCNDNVFIGGRWGIESKADVNGSRYGVLARYQGTNNNVFYKLCFELGGVRLSDPATEAIPILIEGGWLNRFYGMRYEGTKPDHQDGIIARETGSSGENFYEVGFVGEGLVDHLKLDDQSTGTYGASRLMVMKRRPYLDDVTACYHSGDLSRSVTPYSAAEGSLRGLDIVYSNGFDYIKGSRLYARR